MHGASASCLQCKAEEFEVMFMSHATRDTNLEDWEIGS